MRSNGPYLVNDNPLEEIDRMYGFSDKSVTPDSRKTLKARVKGETEKALSLLSKSDIATEEKDEISQIITWLAGQLVNTNDTFVLFEEFLCGEYGDDWYNNELARFLKYLGRIMRNGNN